MKLKAGKRSVSGFDWGGEPLVKRVRANYAGIPVKGGRERIVLPYTAAQWQRRQERMEGLK